MSDLNDDVVLITGGGSGLGLALVARFIEEGARVVTLERSAEKVTRLQQQFGEQIVAVQGDVTSFADNQRAVKMALSRFGRLDCFIGNAGIWDHNASLLATSPEQLESGFNELFAVNVKGYLLGLEPASLRCLNPLAA